MTFIHIFLKKNWEGKASAGWAGSSCHANCCWHVHWQPIFFSPWHQLMIYFHFVNGSTVEEGRREREGKMRTRNVQPMSNHLKSLRLHLNFQKVSLRFQVCAFFFLLLCSLRGRMRNVCLSWNP